MDDRWIGEASYSLVRLGGEHGKTYGVLKKGHQWVRRNLGDEEVPFRQIAEARDWDSALEIVRALRIAEEMRVKK